MSVGEGILFWVLAPIMIVGAMGLLFAKKAVHAALAMAIVMVGLGVTYFGQEAPFLGGVQIFVYTGAVMMLFVFVIMLVGVDSADSLIETIKGQRVVAALLGLGTAALLIGVISQVTLGAPRGLGEVSGSGNVSAIAAEIFGGYVWAFEVTGALLITAALGAMVLAHRERLVPRPTQRELSVKRIREGAVKAPLPAPGVFARNNAVDVPALLPDGTPSELSISRVLTARGQVTSASDRFDETRSVDAELRSPLGEVTAGDSPAGVTPAGDSLTDETSTDETSTGGTAAADRTDREADREGEQA